MRLALALIISGIAIMLAVVTTLAGVGREDGLRAVPPASQDVREYRMGVERQLAAQGRLLRLLTCVLAVWEDGSSMLVDPDGSDPHTTSDDGMSRTCQQFVGLYVGTGQATKDRLALAQ